MSTTKPKIVEYDVCSAENHHGLVQLVNDAIKNGWQPYQGLCSSIQGGCTYIYQAMVRYAAPKKPVKKPIKRKA